MASNTFVLNLVFINYFIKSASVREPYQKFVVLLH